jgi:hypothetical protein
MFCSSIDLRKHHSTLKSHKLRDEKNCGLFQSSLQLNGKYTRVLARFELESALTDKKKIPVKNNSLKPKVLIELLTN